MAELRSPLVADAPPGEAGEAEDFRDGGRTWRAEARALVGLAVPISLTYLLENLPLSIANVAVGHLGESRFLDATALGFMFCNVTCFSIGYGLCNALDTLCSQAHGAGEAKLMGVYLQRGVCVLGLVYVPMFLLNYFAEQILVGIGQPSEVAHLAARLCRVLVLAGPPAFFYELLKKVLEAQSVVESMLYIALAGDVVLAGLCYLFLYVLDWGYTGVAYAVLIVNWGYPLVLVAYLSWSGEGRKFWGGWSRAALRGWGEFLRLGVPGMLMMCTEWWAFELLAVQAGWLRDADTALAGHTLLFNAESNAFMFYLGTGVALNVRVGNYVGASNAAGARLCAGVGLALTFLLTLAFSALVFFLRYEIPKAFTLDRDVRHLVSHVLVVVAAMQVGDGVNAAANGVFRGCGLQYRGAAVNAVAYFLITQPVAYVLAHEGGLGLAGLWWGLCLGVALAALVALGLVARIDWLAMVRDAQERIEEDRSPPSESSALLRQPLRHQKRGESE